jgi:hypothetical protein
MDKVVTAFNDSHVAQMLGYLRPLRNLRFNSDLFQPQIAQKVAARLRRNHTQFGEPISTNVPVSRLN